MSKDDGDVFHTQGTDTVVEFDVAVRTQADDVPFDVGSVVRRTERLKMMRLCITQSVLQLDGVLA